MKPDNQRNQFGGTAGFPIRTDRLFAFASFDRTKLGGKNNYARDLLLPNERTPRLTRGNDTPANRAWIQSIIDRYPASAVPNDPRSNRTYATVIGFDWPDQDYSGRVDWQRGQDHLTARYQYTHQVRATDDVIVGEQARQDNQQQNLGVTWTKILSSRVVTELRYGLGVRDTNVNIADGNTHADRPVHRLAVLGHDHRQRRHVSDSARPARQSVRREPLVGVRAQPLVQGRHRHPQPAARRLRRQQLARAVDVQPRVRRRHLRHAVRRVPRRLHRVVHDRLRAVSAREPDRREQLLRRRQLAHPSDADVESRVPLRVRRRARRERGSDQLRLRCRQRQLRAAARHGVDASGGDWVAYLVHRRGRRRLVAARRLRHLPRPRLPVRVFTERRQPAHQSAERARAPDHDNAWHSQRLRSHAGLRLRARSADHPALHHPRRRESGDAVHPSVERRPTSASCRGARACA